MITEQTVLSALATITDPDIHRDIVSLGCLDRRPVHEGALSSVPDFDGADKSGRREMRMDIDAVWRGAGSRSRLRA